MAAQQLSLIDDKVALARRFDELHEFIYRRGGVRPVNAAIDELCKLLLLRVHLARYPDLLLGGLPLAQVMDPAYLRAQGTSAPRLVRSAFDEVNVHADYQWADSGGFFLEGDSLRLTEPEVLAEAVALVLAIPVPGERESGADDRLAEEDAAGLAFEVFLRGRYEHSGGLGTYLTPEPVVEAMTRMAVGLIPLNRLAADDLLIGDPCSGTGRFLISAMRHVESRQRATGTADPSGVERLRQTAFFGADQSDSSLLKARLNFLMYGVTRPRLLRVDDSLTADGVVSLVGKFDVILTNPPFGGGKYDRPEGMATMRRDDLGTVAGWGWRRAAFAKRWRLDRADPAVLFWDFDLSLLRPRGVLAIVLPDGALGPKYSWLHDALVRGVDGRGAKAELLGVVSLPRQTFALSGTAAKTSFLVLRRPEGKSSPGEVFLARSEHVGYTQRAGQLAADPEGNDLPEIAAAFAAHTSGFSVPIGGWSVVPAAAMQRDLDANRTVSVVGREGVPRLADLATSRPKRARIRGERDSYFLSILHVGGDCLVDWVSARNYAPKTPGRECREGDVLVSCLNPQIPRVAFIPKGAGDGLCSAEFAVLQPANVDAARLALLLRTDEMTRYLASAGRGTSSSRRRIDVNQILDAPIPSVELTDETAEGFRFAVEADRRARVELARILEGLQSAP